MKKKETGGSSCRCLSTMYSQMSVERRGLTRSVCIMLVVIKVLVKGRQEESSRQAVTTDNAVLIDESDLFMWSCKC